MTQNSFREIDNSNKNILQETSMLGISLKFLSYVFNS